MMNEKQEERSPRGDSTALHLSGFAHQKPVPPKTGGDAVEGFTIFIRRSASEAVKEYDHPVVVPSNAAPLTPDELLGALAYCYTKGVFGSEDIEQRMLCDPEYRAALHGVVPDPTALRKFRRLNRQAILVLLEKFYRHFRSQCVKHEEAGPATTSSPSVPARPWPKQPPKEEGTTTIEIKREARDLLDLATFVDRMSDSA
jgi:Transposase domain (DUF772)